VIRFRHLPVLALTVATLATPNPVAAQDMTASDAADYQVAGSTPVVCTLALADGSDDRLLNFRAADRNFYQVEEMVSPATLSTRAASFEITLDGVCNSAHRIRVESLNNGLWQVSETPPARPDGFGTAVPYQLTVRWSQRTVQLSADAGVRQLREEVVPIGEPAGGDLLLQFDIAEGATNVAANAPLVAGSYSDTITVTLEPQQ